MAKEDDFSIISVNPNDNDNDNDNDNGNPNDNEDEVVIHAGVYSSMPKEAVKTPIQEQDTDDTPKATELPKDSGDIKAASTISKASSKMQDDLQTSLDDLNANSPFPKMQMIVVGAAVLVLLVMVGFAIYYYVGN